MSMKTSTSGTPGPDLSKLPSLAPPPNRPVSQGLPLNQGHRQGDSATESPQITQTLADLIDRSLAQVVILRSALDEAVLLDSSSRTAAAELATRLETLAGASTDLDARLARCDAAAATFQNAARALDELNAVASQIRAAGAVIDQRINAQLADHQRRLDGLLANQKAALDRAIAHQQAHFAARIAEFDAAFTAQLRELGQVHTRAAASAHHACERAVQSTRAAGANAMEASRQTIAAAEEEIAARTASLTTRLRDQAAEAATAAALHAAKAQETDEALRARLEQAAQLVNTLDRRLAEILDQSKKPPLRRAA